MKAAIIDLGTNTFSLLIFEKKNKEIKSLFSHKIAVAIGLGGINDNLITDDAFERGIDALSQFKYMCDQHQVEKIRGIGTSALRGATNGTDFIDAVYNMTEIPITIVDGDTEAQLIYEGVKSAHYFEANSIILDIGGGSSELIYANNDHILKAQSFEMGVSRILQLNEFNDPFTQCDIALIETYLEQHTKDFFDDIKTTVLVGASGSFETIYEMVNNTSFPKGSATKGIEFGRLLNCLDELIHSSLEERKLNDRIIPIRKIMAPIAAVKIKWLIEKLGIETVHISSNALKEGAIEVLF
mgnify:FL=1